MRETDKWPVLLHYIIDFKRIHRKSPTNKNMRESLVLSPARLSQLLKFLETKGHIKRSNTIKILRKR